MLNTSQHQHGLLAACFPPPSPCRTYVPLPLIALVTFHHAAGQLRSLIRWNTNPSPMMAEPSMGRVSPAWWGWELGAWRAQGRGKDTWLGCDIKKRSPCGSTIQPNQLIKQYRTKLLCWTKPLQHFFSIQLQPEFSWW